MIEFATVEDHDEVLILTDSYPCIKYLIINFLFSFISKHIKAGDSTMFI